MIPVYEPIIGEEEIDAIVNALSKGELSGSFGNLLKEFEIGFAQYCGCKYGVAVTSGTAALHLAVATANIKSGDEILVSALTNIATGLAAYHNGAIPIAVDAEKETWNLDINLIETLITSKTKAIIPVHIFGHPVDMERLCKISKKYNLIVIEDCAQSHGATFKGQKTGSFGEMGCFSFYANKVITTGEGGMIVTNNSDLAEEAKLLRNLAFGEPRFKHRKAGFNYRMTGYQAAMGIAQLKKIDQIIAAKRRIAQTYNYFLADVEYLQLPTEKENAFNVYWMYAIVLKESFPISRNHLQFFLKKNGIDTRTFFCPMNQQPCFANQKGYRQISCPTAERLWESGLYLPSSLTLSERSIKNICETIKSALI